MKYPKNANFFMFILMLFLIFITNIILVSLIKLFPNILKIDYIWIYQSIFAISSFIIPIILYMVIKKVSFKELIPLNPLSLKNFFLIVFIGFAIQPFLQLIGSITNLFHKDEISEVIYTFASLSYPKALFVTAIVPAITEELAFRGVILTGYKKTSLLTGVLMSSFYFGVMHLTITQLFYAIVAGILFAFLVKVTKSIYSSILIHFIFNGTQVTLAYYLSRAIPNDILLENTPSNVESFLSSLSLFIKTLPFLLLSIFLFIKFNKKEITYLIEENKEIKNNPEKPKVFTLFFFLNIILYLFFMILKNLNF